MTFWFLAEQWYGLQFLGRHHMKNYWQAVLDDYRYIYYCVLNASMPLAKHYVFALGQKHYFILLREETPPLFGPMRVHLLKNTYVSVGLGTVDLM